MIDRILPLAALLSFALAGSLGAQETPAEAGSGILDPDVPPFCQQGVDHPEAGQGHPEHEDWCRREVQGLHGSDQQTAAVRRNRGEPVEPFCRDGRGHPEFGTQWCFDKQAERTGGGAAVSAEAEEGARSEEPFCRSGAGHPEHGQIWCTMTDEEWEEYRQEQESGTGGSSPR